MTSDRASVLLIDDDAAFLTTEKLILEDEFDVDTVPTPRLALEMLERKSYQVIAADYHLPSSMTGLELLERAQLVQPNASILLVTADHTLSRVAVHVFLILKPFAPKDFITVVRNLANVSRMHQATAAAATRASRLSGLGLPAIPWTPPKSKKSE